MVSKIIIIVALVFVATVSGKNLDGLKDDTQSGSPKLKRITDFFDPRTGLHKQYWYDNVHRTFAAAERYCVDTLGVDVHSASIGSIAELDHFGNDTLLPAGYYWTSGLQTVGYVWDKPRPVTSIGNDILARWTSPPPEPLCISFRKTTNTSIQYQNCLTPSVSIYTLCQQIV